MATELPHGQDPRYAADLTGHLTAEFSPRRIALDGDGLYVVAGVDRLKFVLEDTEDDVEPDGPGAGQLRSENETLHMAALVGVYPRQAVAAVGGIDADPAGRPHRTAKSVSGTRMMAGSPSALEYTALIAYSWSPMVTRTLALGFSATHSINVSALISSAYAIRVRVVITPPRIQVPG